MLPFSKYSLASLESLHLATGTRYWYQVQYTRVRVVFCALLRRISLGDGGVGFHRRTSAHPPQRAGRKRKVWVTPFSLSCTPFASFLFYARSNKYLAIPFSCVWFDNSYLPFGTHGIQNSFATMPYFPRIFLVPVRIVLQWAWYGT
jgi:hypothetical protein